MTFWYLPLLLASLSLPVNVNEDLKLSRGVITGSRVNLRETASLQGDIIRVLPMGTQVVVKENQNQWVGVSLVDGSEGWVFRDYVSTDPEVINFREKFVQRINRLTRLAYQYIGSRYRYGGASPRGFDCSGFTMFVYNQFGWKLPHSAAAQMRIGTAVGKVELLPGDLVFFRTKNAKYVNHVGIYLGSGNFIHAASGYGAVRISNLEDGYYRRRFCGARRLA